MAYDEDLAGRVREVMPPDAEVTERKMFGGLAFLLRGHMFAGIVGSELMVRIGSEAAQRALELDHVREMDFTGRPMKNMIFVQPAGLRGPALERWITAAADMPGPSPENSPSVHDAAPTANPARSLYQEQAIRSAGGSGSRLPRHRRRGTSAQSAAVRW